MARALQALQLPNHAAPHAANSVCVSSISRNACSSISTTEASSAAFSYQAPIFLVPSWHVHRLSTAIIESSINLSSGVHSSAPSWGNTFDATQPILLDDVS